MGDQNYWVTMKMGKFSPQKKINYASKKRIRLIRVVYRTTMLFLSSHWTYLWRAISNLSEIMGSKMSRVGAPSPLHSDGGRLQLIYAMQMGKYCASRRTEPLVSTLENCWRSRFILEKRMENLVRYEQLLKLPFKTYLHTRNLKSGCFLYK